MKGITAHAQHLHSSASSMSGASLRIHRGSRNVMPRESIRMNQLTSEHRQFERVPLRLEVEWNGCSNAQYPDVTSDVSLGGCYVETLSSVAIGSVLNLKLHLPCNMMMSFPGEVLYHHPTIGFGIKFLPLTVQQVQALKALIEDWEQRAEILAA
jgi:hypothetical protein